MAVRQGRAGLIDIWLDDGRSALALRRVISRDATIQMSLVQQAATPLRLEDELHLRLVSTARVRDKIRFSGARDFRAVWKAFSGGSWQPIMDRTCQRN